MPVFNGYLPESMLLYEGLNNGCSRGKKQTLLLTFTTLSKKIMSVLLVWAAQTEAVLYPIRSARWVLWDENGWLMVNVQRELIDVSWRVAYALGSCNVHLCAAAEKVSSWLGPHHG